MRFAKRKVLLLLALLPAHLLAETRGGYLPPVVPAIAKSDLQKSGFTVAELNIREIDLYGENGILFYDEHKNNRLERGKNWERPGEFSFYSGGKFIFSRPVGVRIHGGSSRMFADNSFRLYFHHDPVPPRAVFPDSALVFDRLLIHRANDFISFFADAISSWLNAENTKITPTAFLLNDRFWGVYFLGEHLSARQWQNYVLDRNDFYFYVFKSENSEELERESAIAFEELRTNWLLKAPRLTLAEAKKHVDIQNFIAHMFTFAYLGTTDWLQGAAIKDGKKSGRWKFVHWDLEQSIIDEAVKKKNICIDLARPNWQQESFELFLTGVKWNRENSIPRPFIELDFRHLLFYRLWFEDPEFRGEFSSFVSSALAQKLTQKKLLALAEGYLTLAQTLPMQTPETVLAAREFLRNRNGEIAKKLKLINSFPYIPWQSPTDQDRPKVLHLFGYPDREGCR